jgi:hypothetical protein
MRGEKTKRSAIKRESRLSFSSLFECLAGVLCFLNTKYLPSRARFTRDLQKGKHLHMIALSLLLDIRLCFYFRLVRSHDLNNFFFLPRDGEPQYRVLDAHTGEKRDPRADVIRFKFRYASRSVLYQQHWIYAHMCCILCLFRRFPMAGSSHKLHLCEIQGKRANDIQISLGVVMGFRSK